MKVLSNLYLVVTPSKWSTWDTAPMREVLLGQHSSFISPIHISDCTTKERYEGMPT